MIECPFIVGYGAIERGLERAQDGAIEVATSLWMYDLQQGHRYPFISESVTWNIY